jgi:hypothetical protein
MKRLYIRASDGYPAESFRCYAGISARKPTVAKEANAQWKLAGPDTAPRIPGHASAGRP